MRRFITLSGEAIFTLGVNYPLKVAAFDPALPGCIRPGADTNLLDHHFKPITDFDRNKEAIYIFHHVSHRP